MREGGKKQGLEKFGKEDTDGWMDGWMMRLKHSVWKPRKMCPRKASRQEYVYIYVCIYICRRLRAGIS